MPAQFLSAVATSRMTSVVSAGGLLGRNRGCYSIPLTRRSVRLLSELCVGIQPGDVGPSGRIEGDDRCRYG
jgi:hypothetical protein